MGKKVPIVAFSIVIVSLISSTAYSQGWVGNGGNNLNAVNSSLSSTPISIGVGTTAPSAQLHTTGTLRFENLVNSNAQSRLLVTDTSGNVFWKDASTIGTQNAWLLNGNSGTNQALNFLGTTDLQSLNFRTNNTQRMTILGQNGFVGVGVANPRVRLHVSNSIGTMGFPYESAVVENGGDTKFTVCSSDPAGAGGASIVLGHSNFTAPGVGGVQRYHGYEMQYAINGARWLRFNYVQRDAAGTIVGDVSNIMVLSDQGRVGVGLGPVGGGLQPIMPTAVFHTNGAIRFQNLPAGTGNVLVVDANGNVFRSAGTAKMATKSDANEMQKVKDELRELKAELQTLKNLIAEKNRSTEIKEITISQKPQLLQNAPNPFSETTTIKYVLPKEVHNAVINISNLQGTQLKQFKLPQGGGQSVEISGGELAAGSYIYSLVVNNKVIDSKKMILVR